MLSWLKKLLMERKLLRSGVRDGLRSSQTGAPASVAFRNPAEEFPESWRAVLRRDVAFYQCLPLESQTRLEDLIWRFIHEKQWWGAEGLVVTDRMKVIVAAYACLLVLGSDRFGLFPRTKEIILYPREFGERVQAVAPDGRVMDVEDVLLGESHYRGPVLLAWDSIEPRRDESEEPADRECLHVASEDDGLDEPRVEGYVILHEFAHALDNLDAVWTGEHLVEETDIGSWIEDVRAEYESLVRASRRGRRTFLDPYGAENPAEFFAVVTESFFETPSELKRRHPRLYERMRQFYAQDPASWADAGKKDGLS